MTRVELMSSGMLLLTAGVQFVIALLLFVRKLHREVPTFVLYTGFQIVFAICSVFVYLYTSSHFYFYFYWASDAVSIVLGFFIIHEIFRVLFRSYESLLRIGKWVLLAGGIVLVLFGLALATTGEGAVSTRVSGPILVADRSVRVVQSGLLATIFVFAAYFGVRWRQYLRGIALGFTIFATFDTLYAAGGLELGRRAKLLFWFAPMVMYLITVSVWLGLLLVREPAMKEVSLTRSEDLDKWNEALRQLLTK